MAEILEKTKAEPQRGSRKRPKRGEKSVLRRRLDSFLSTPAGQVAEALVYAALLALVCIYFTGNGQFIYEAF